MQPLPSFRLLTLIKALCSPVNGAGGPDELSQFIAKDGDKAWISKCRNGMNFLRIDQNRWLYPSGRVVDLQVKITNLLVWQAYKHKLLAGIIFYRLFGACEVSAGE